MHSVTIILKTRMTKAELHIKGINIIHPVCIQSGLFTLFIKLCVVRVFDSKSSGCKAKPPQWHARFFVARGQQTKDVDQVQICLKYDSAAMYCRHAKKSSINKNPWCYQLGQHQKESYGFRQRVPQTWSKLFQEL